jgi:metal-sulfur cluster biosynthetic enzyme
MSEKTQGLTDLEDRKPDAEAPALDDIKGCVGVTGGAEGLQPVPPRLKRSSGSSDTCPRSRPCSTPRSRSIFTIHLIYRIDIDGDRNVDLDMTLTAPGCPVAGDMPRWVENATSAVPGVGQVKVNLVFDPLGMSGMSDEAKLALNMF